MRPAESAAMGYPRTTGNNPMPTIFEHRVDGATEERGRRGVHTGDQDVNSIVTRQSGARSVAAQVA